MLKALTRPITDRQHAQAGNRAAATNTYDPHAYAIAKLPPLEVWDPATNPEHKEIQLLIETETEERTTIQAASLQQVQRGAPWGRLLLFLFCISTELVSGISVAVELGAQGPNAILSGLLLGATIFYLVLEVHQ